MEQLKTKVPAHVPPELVWDHSFEEFLSEGDDPYLAAGRLHDGPGVIWATDATYGGAAWIPTRHELLKEAYADFEHFSNGRNRLTAAVLAPDWMLLPVEADPPEHHFYRHILAPHFTPSAISKCAAEAQALCDTLIAKFERRGSCEFISEFAAIFPNSIVISLLGMPQEMLSQFVEWEDAAIHGTDNEERMAAGAAIIDYLKGFIAEQKEDPGTDVMKAILSGHLKERPLNDAEMLGIVYMLYVAGLDTVYDSLGWIMRELARDHTLQNRLRNSPEDIPAAVDEFTRAFGVSAPNRVVAKDFAFHGVPMRKGDPVILPTYLAGRDPRAFENPHVIDVDRKPRHITFGNGPHLCLGIHLAKREMRIVIESFLSRLNNIRIPEGAIIEYHTRSTIGVDRLPIEWDPV